VQNAIVGKDCKIGQWSRIDGEPAAMDGDGKQLDITILGELPGIATPCTVLLRLMPERCWVFLAATNVTVAKETVIRS
jgi:hypothetical protein